MVNRIKFSEHLWRSIAPVFEQILEHPFTQKLAEGSLEKDRFLFYLKQDAVYLKHFSYACTLAAKKSRSSQITDLFTKFAQDALREERELHQQFLNKNLDKHVFSPACFAYTQHITAQAEKASLEEVTASILPCFWIYREVGHHIAKKSTPNNPYSGWIKAYANPDFSSLTDQVINLLNEHASRSSTTTLSHMKTAFTYSAHHEWHFWDDAYRMIAQK